MMNRLFLYFLVALLVIAGSSCRMTKFVPDDQYLLNDVKIEIDNKQVDREGVKGQVRQRENSKILGLFRMNLFIYNLSSNKREKGFFKKIGEAPVIYDEMLMSRSEKQLEQYMRNKGYYHSRVTSSIDLNGKKAAVFFKVEANQPHRIGSISYRIKDENIEDDFIKSGVPGTLIREGDIFDVDVLRKERVRLSRVMNDQGYFKFAEEYIYYQIDTANQSHTAHIEMIVEKAQNPVNNQIDQPHRKYFVDGYEFYIESPRRERLASALQTFNDTLTYDGYSFFFNNKMPLRESLFFRSMDILPGNHYSKRGDELSYSNLYGLRQFRFVNIQYRENTDKEDSLVGHLTGKVVLPLQMPLAYSLDVEGTNTSGNMGVAGNVTYQHKNLFRGAEIFDLTFRGATERQEAKINNESTVFLVRELGAEAKLLFPGFLFPYYERKFRLSSMPQTRFSVAYNFQERPDYTLSTANATFGYQWRSGANYAHFLNPLSANIIRVLRLDPVFEDKIKDLFIKSSYEDHLISATNYSMIFNKQNVGRRGNYRYTKVSSEIAGNTLWLMSKVLNRTSYLTDDTDPNFITSYYRIFDTRFAQYIKADIDFRRGYRIDEKQAFAWRAFVGTGLPYGNLNVIPIERRYYSGGSNGIRAWQVRSLGPGSFTGGVSEYPNQSADIKLEANAEYRFKMFWMLEGAMFLDAGNIWSISPKDNREGAVFKFDRFYNEFAVGTGLGVRLVYSFVVVRADLGLKLRDPALPAGDRWIPSQRKFNGSDLGFNFAVGYPF